MIILDTTLKSLEILLSGAVATTQWAFYTSYVDIPTAATSFTPGANDGVSNSTTAATIVAAPAASTTRQVKMISVVNKDTVQGTVTIQLNNNSTKRTLLNVPLAPNEELTFVDGVGWQAFDSVGNTKGAGTAGRSSGLKYTYSSDVTGSDPGAGAIKFNNVSLASVTTARIRLNVDAESNDNTAFIETWDASTTTGARGFIKVYKDGYPNVFVILEITSAGTISTVGGFDIAESWSVTVVASAGSFTNGDTLKVEFSRTGDKGATGSTGQAGGADPRESTIASSATPTPNSDTTDIYTITALAAGATLAAPTGTPVQGRVLLVRIKDNGTARALGYNGIYRAIGITLPTTTVISKTLYILFVYNFSDTKWDAVATNQEA